MVEPILNLGNGKWGIKESAILGYIAPLYFNSGNTYLADEFVFTRATTSTLINSQGIIEDSCYNLLQRSEEFDNSYWFKNNAIISANTTTAPNGTLTADKFVENGLNGPRYKNVLLFSSSFRGNCSYSVYAKVGGRNFLRMALNDGISDTYFCTFNLSAGTVGTVGNCSATITNSGNGWYRCAIISNVTTGTNLSPALAAVLVDNGSITYQGDGVSGIFIWGEQFEYGSTIRPYLKTTNRLNTPKVDFSFSGTPMLLVEPQRTNLSLNSEDFTNASWTRQNVTASANTNLNIFNINKSNYIYDTSSNTVHNIYNTINLVGGSSYSSYVIVKKADDSWVQLATATNPFGADKWFNFNFDTGLMGNMGSGGIYDAKYLVNGWWKLSILNSLASGSVTTTHFSICATNDSDSVRGPAYIGSNRRFVDVCAWQTEVGANSTSYIPTTSVAVTRNADTSYYDLSGNTSNLYYLNPYNFTLQYEGYLANKGNSSISFGLSDTTSYGNNGLFYYHGISPVVRQGGVVTENFTPLANQVPFKAIIRRNGNSIDFFRNGVNIWSTTANIFNYRYLVLQDGGSTYNVDNVKLYSETFSDASCISLTQSNLIPYVVAAYNLSNNLDAKGNYPLTAGSDITYSSGKNGNAANFIATINSNFTIPDNNAFSFTNGINDLPFSITMWLKFSATTNAGLVDKRNNIIANTQEYSIQYFGNVFYFTIFDATATSSTNRLDITYSFTPIVGQYYHLACTYDASALQSGLKMYINGVSVGATTLLGTYTKMTNTTSTVKIGNAGFVNDRNFNGQMDELYFFNKALTQSEVNQLQTIFYPFN